MDLLVAYKNDPAGHNMAKFISQNMNYDGDVYRGKNFDLIEIDSPAISADWLDEKYEYDGFIFLSKHAAESGTLALTCHSTGNFDEAKFGGNQKELAIPYPDLQKRYMQKLWDNHESFSDFEITIEATHHGPTHLKKPSIFVEIGTTELQWNDETLCFAVAQLVVNTLEKPRGTSPFAICFGGTHYSEKFTKELLFGKYALGTVMPKHALNFLTPDLFEHLLTQNNGVQAALLDWKSLGKYKQTLIDLLSTTKLEIFKI
ncbi:MAG: D-tyrosyl-tRNA(Tyr) deacylase [Candidatus Nitrosopelagicus sp.]|jgi:D-aminoacyl-tRNA deacylase|nr:D-tyrosyl-tRNA(Tyr) deacylase [Candidatus Nitrosopelagicus sp.]MBT6646806.1 D-tyrosyl-tRNA(Tyr) deacylase [Nitrososphaerota archaeon]MBT7253049.1 D-tyrosyl-tRNA(Tyr) deacylase [Candidatus Nitrosopelagicus sp.]